MKVAFRFPFRYAWVVLLTSLVPACSGFGEIRVQGPAGESLTIDRDYFKSHWAEHRGLGSEARLPLERALADSGYSLVESLILELKSGEEWTFPWELNADEASVTADGQIEVAGKVFDAHAVRANAHPDLALVEAGIIDLAATAAQALGIPPPAESRGRALDVPDADRVLLILLDGFGYRRYEQARQAGLIPNLAALSDPIVGVTTYPPITPVSTASLLTGAPPTVHGADRRGIRMTEVETLLDVARESGLDVKAVEGEALAFQLRGADFELSGDRNGDGMTDDEVLANALEILVQGAPDLFFVHFHGIDNAGHAYGPDSSEERQIVAFVDEAVGLILDAMPENSLVLIFADHGMHAVNETGRLGNHGHLIPLDMLIPIIMENK